MLAALLRKLGGQQAYRSADEVFAEIARLSGVARRSTRHSHAIAGGKSAGRPRNAASGVRGNVFKLTYDSVEKGSTHG